jgi:predicted secreted Zn-dependent protease
MEPSPGRPSRPRPYEALLSLVLIAGVLIACSKPSSGRNPAPAGPDVAQPAPSQVATASLPSLAATGTATAPDRVRLVTSTATQTYSVYGASTDEILGYIGSYGPLDDQGQRATGLTETNWSLSWDNNHDPKACSIVSMTIKLDIKVTLPLLDHPERLPAALQGNWTGFAAAIAAHEQHHVETALAGASRLKDNMAAIVARASCTTLESDVNGAWSAQQARTAADQNQFHAQDQARVAAIRDPITAQINAGSARLESLKTQIASLDNTLRDLGAQMDTLSNSLKALKSQMTALEAQYPGLTMPPSVAQQYDSLSQQYNALVPAYNALVDNYNATLARRRASADEGDSLRASLNDLVDRYKWTR